jgi:6-phosphogluconolactonase
MTAPAPRPVLFLHADEDEWVRAACADLVEALEWQLHERGAARLLLSGGNTPAPVHRALARSPVPWARIRVGLVDERWLPPGDPASNARLVRETLLEEGAAAAHFEPMPLPPESTMEASLHAANALSVQDAIVVLGMGEDGHTASLFPEAPGLPAALAAKDDYVAIDAGAASVAQPWPQRLSLTPAGLARTSTRLLLLRGERKRAVLLRALEGENPLELPVRVAFALPGAPLRIHWCP